MRCTIVKRKGRATNTGKRKGKIKKSEINRRKIKNNIETKNNIHRLITNLNSARYQ